MADYFNGEISIPVVFLTEQVKELLAKQFGADFMKKGFEDGPVVSFSDAQAANGMFESLEGALVDMGVPFDRHSEGFCEFEPEHRYYRPAGDASEAIDHTGISVDGDTFVSTGKLKGLLQLTPTEVINRLKELIEEVEPTIPDLSLWSETRYAHLVGPDETADDGFRSMTMDDPHVLECHTCHGVFRYQRTEKDYVGKTEDGEEVDDYYVECTHCESMEQVGTVRPQNFTILAVIEPNKAS